MSSIIYVYNLIFYQPLFNALIWLYNSIPGHDIGLAILLLTLAIRLILFPLYYKSIKSQRALQDIQPQVDALRKQYKNEQDKLGKELMILYKNEKINPFSSCLPLLVQLPFLFAVFQVFRQGLLSKNFELLYPFVHNPGTVNTVTIGFFDLSQKALVFTWTNGISQYSIPAIILALLAGLAQYWQGKMMVTKNPPLIKGKEIEGSADEKMTAVMNKQIVYFMPLLTVFMGISFPAGLTLYWCLTTLLMALQQVWMFKKKSKESKMGIEG